jgi:predicted RNA binding protein YcfA (HicA-like mRNA interferase family)
MAYHWKKVMSGTEVVSMLKDNDWVKVRQAGSHVIMQKNGISCPVPLHKELKKGTLASIRRIVAQAD